MEPPEDTQPPAALPRRRRRAHMAGQLRSGQEPATTGTPFSAFTPTVPAVPSQAPGDAPAAFRAGTGRSELHTPQAEPDHDD